MNSQFDCKPVSSFKNRLGILIQPGAGAVVAVDTQSRLFHATADQKRPLLALIGISHDLAVVWSRRRQLAEAPSRNVPAEKIAASYARYPADLHHSMNGEMQQANCRNRAKRDGRRILPEFEFWDAVSGDSYRPGLDALLEAADSGRFHVLYLASLSRLGRDSALMTPILVHLIYDNKIRVIGVSDGFDSAQDHGSSFAT